MSEFNYETAFKLAGIELKHKPFIISFNPSDRTFIDNIINLFKIYTRKQIIEIYHLIDEYIGEYYFIDKIDKKFKMNLFSLFAKTYCDFKYDQIMKHGMGVLNSFHIADERIFIIGGNKNIVADLSKRDYEFDGVYHINSISSTHSYSKKIRYDQIFSIMTDNHPDDITYVSRINEYTENYFICSKNIWLYIYIIYVDNDGYIHRDRKDSNGYTLPAILCYDIYDDDKKIDKIKDMFKKDMSIIHQLRNISDFDINDIEQNSSIKIWYRNGLIHREDFSSKTGRLLPAYYNESDINMGKNYIYNGRKIIGLNTYYGFKRLKP